MLINVGLVLSLSCVLYLATVNVAGPLLQKEVEEALDAEEGDEIGEAPLDILAARTARRVVISGYQRTYRRSNSSVLIALVLGTALIAGGVELLELRARRHRG